MVRGSNEGVEKWLKSTKNLTVYEGHARFVNTHQVLVGDEFLQADKSLLTWEGEPLFPRCAASIR